MKKSILPRFEKYIKYPVDVSGCWIWDASRNGYGYGKFRIKKMEYAHRVSYELYKGKIPIGINVLHSCDNTSCVNPDHLFLGTQKDNVQDMVGKNRCNPSKGEKHFRSKLDWPKVMEIRWLYFWGEETKSLAKKYGVAIPTIQSINRFETWKNIGCSD